MSIISPLQVSREVFRCGLVTAAEHKNGQTELCVQERAASANRTEAAWSDRTYDCCTPVSLPHWARTADDPSDALWCRWVWHCRSRVATELTRWRETEEQVGWRSDRCCVCDTELQNSWTLMNLIDMSLSIYIPRPNVLETAMRMRQHKRVFSSILSKPHSTSNRSVKTWACMLSI